MNPTSFLFGALAFAFLFFITVRGDLGKWLGLLGLANAAPAGSIAPSLPVPPVPPMMEPQQ